jgi:hypothetical protein
MGNCTAKKKYLSRFFSLSPNYVPNLRFAWLLLQRGTIHGPNLFDELVVF